MAPEPGESRPWLFNSKIITRSWASRARRATRTSKRRSANWRGNTTRTWPRPRRAGRGREKGGGGGEIEGDQGGLRSAERSGEAQEVRRAGAELEAGRGISPAAGVAASGRAVHRRTRAGRGI